MKKFLSILFIALLPMLLLTGCFETLGPKTVIVYKLVTPPVDLTALCPIETPPNKQAYMQSSIEERERLLWEFSMNQTKNLFLCNARLVEIPKWKAEQEKIYLDPNLKPK
jgi:hypothetical protein